MTIYIASKTKHAAKWRALRACGWRIISTWIDEAGLGQTTDRADLALRCIKEPASADLFILYHADTEVLKGALIEAGAALQAGKLVLCVGDVDCVFSAHPYWRSYQSFEQLSTYLTEIGALAWSNACVK